MKKIDKYQKASGPSSLAEELQRYKKMSSTLRKSQKQGRSKRLNQLALLFPFAAASLSPLGIQAQCGAVVTEVTPGTDYNINFDGGGQDIRINANTLATNPAVHDLYINMLNANFNFVAYAMGGFNYASRFNSGQNITSGMNFVAGAGTMDYNLAGAWHTAGTITGFVGIRFAGNRLGFIEVTWNAPAGTITIGDVGVQDVAQAGNTSIPAGSCAVLPVELISFDAKLNEGQVNLAWATHSETDNRGFDIERSTDGVNYESIGFIPGQGNSVARIDYTFTDQNIKSNRQYYYRLRQVDYWDSEFYSKIINIETERTLDFELGPNPVSGDIINVSFGAEGNNETWELSIFDIRGQQVAKTINVTGEYHSIDMDIAGLVSGTYFVKLSSPMVNEYKKFIKQD